MEVFKTITKKHLDDGQIITGYGWKHFRDMYNTHTTNIGSQGYISDACLGWKNHVKHINSKKKESKKIPTKSNTIPEIKAYLEENKIPLQGASKKDELLELVEISQRK